MTAAITSVGVQQVSITIGSGATSNTATITAVGAGAFILYQGQTTIDFSDANAACARIELTNPTTVTATRNTSSTDTVTINAVIIDGDTTNLIKSVQSGTITILTAATTGTATISAVTNTNTAVAFLGFSTAAILNLTRDEVALSLAGTTVTATRSATNGATVVGYCVIEFQGAALNSSTQNISIDSAGAGTTFTATITSVTVNNTMLIWGGQFTGASSTSEAKDFGRFDLTNATTVTVTVNTAPAVTTNTYKCVVVEFVSAMLAQAIQRGTIAIAAGTSNTATITSSPTAETVCNWLGNTTTATTAQFNTSIASITQTNATTLTETLGTSGSVTGSYEVVDFNPAGVATNNQAFPGYYRWFAQSGSVQSV